MLISLLKTEAVSPEEATVGALWRLSIVGKFDVVRRRLVSSACCVVARGKGDPKLDVDAEEGSLVYVGLYCRGVGTHEPQSEDITRDLFSSSY